MQKFELKEQDVLVVGLGSRGRAASELLHREGARVLAVDDESSDNISTEINHLRALGIEAMASVKNLPDRPFSVAVLSPVIPTGSKIVQQILRREIPMVGELEIGFQHSRCLTIGVAGTNGKSTVAELIERVLTVCQRKAIVAGDEDRPVCAVAEQTRDLDYLVLKSNSVQLELTEFFRPAVAVLTSLEPDHLDRYASADNYAKANSRIFRNQQAFDWAIIQAEALERLKHLSIPVPGKTITYSAKDNSADIYLDRGLLISRLPNWPGPLLDMDHCQMRGTHNAENLMAALAVGHVLRLPLETMVGALKTFQAGPHRLEFVAEIKGVQYVNDAKCSNVDALRQALASARSGTGTNSNVILIAGGRDGGLDFHDAGPGISQRVKHAFVLDDAAEKLRAAWSLFTPCTVSGSLIEAIAEAARIAVPGDVVLFSPACSSSDKFRNYKNRGQEFCSAVKSIGSGVPAGTPNIQRKMVLV
jgi:UDP-N-acetylmuramoylalanine--D-glutamate ligase